MNNRKEIHDRVLNATSKEELMAVYGEWADKYDKDLLEEMGYIAPVAAGRLLLKYLKDNDVCILDAGCGTGIVGEFMSKNGYNNIEGLDYSQHMLEKAREKNIYKTLVQGDLMSALDIADNSYDAIISVGTFTCGHVGPEALGELVRVTKPGGYICFTVREQAWQEDNYTDKVDDLEKNGDWKLQEIQTADYIQQEGSNCKVCLYRVAV
jgi:predicted TPR repeat methyltransferase